MVFESELDLEDFNETARAYLYAGVECHYGSVLSDGCSVIGVSAGPFVHHINMQHLHLNYIHKDFYPYLWVSVNIPQEVLKKH